MIGIVGAGGTASYLVPALAKVVNPEEILIIDGDELEHRNLDRQLFTSSEVGMNKAEALANRYGTAFHPEFLGPFTRLPQDYVGPGLWFVCADNHAARREVLGRVDADATHCIIGGNEYTDAEAYYYFEGWKDTEKDPRVFYPEILTDDTGDPLRPRGCTGQAQEENRQLAISNMISAAYMLHLYWFLCSEQEQERRLSITPTSIWPRHHFSNFAKIQTVS